MNESSILQSNYQLEISALENITEQTQSELLEQKKLISEIQSKIGSIGTSIGKTGIIG